jgi:hypothetical protein
MLVALYMASPRPNPDAATPQTPSTALSANDMQLLAPVISTLQSF